MNIFISRAWLKTLAGFFINLSASWFGVAVISPNFFHLNVLQIMLFLTKNLGISILCLLATVKIEKLIEYYE